MKVKLLKKVRKRYSITYYPDGLYFSGSWYTGPLTFLEDNEDSWRYEMLRDEKEKSYQKAYEILKEWIILDNPRMGKRKNLRVEKLWYK